jgi:peptidyl-prolyl cis-trans isomerase SurA
MKLNLFSLVVVLFLSASGVAQTSAKEVLFSVENEPVYLSEFIRVYTKNLNLVQDESQKDVDEYLKLFTNYKLKLKEAKAQGLNEKETYKKELKNYKSELTKNYMTDHEVTDALIKEAYANVSQDIKASHILVRLNNNATPKDTLAAFNQIKNLRERALKEGFDVVRKAVHNGETLFGEELGWFTGFRMVYNFEKVAFATPIDSISQPFKTRFGYHIVKVEDKRKARGSCSVKHIMITKPKDSSAAAKTRIDEIYKKIQQGEEFEALAKQFSDDKNSASSGGLLKPFSSGDLSVPEFEDAAFNLTNKGDISKPIQTNFGWHIIKLEKKAKLKDFERLKPELERKVKRDTRSQLIEEALIERLKEKYNIVKHEERLDYFVSIMTDAFRKRTWNLPESFKGDPVFMTIGKQSFTNADFGKFLESYQNRTLKNKSFQTIVEEAYNAFLKTKIKAVEEENLEFENEEFANVLNEYREGLLLFDLMQSTIWDTAKTDSTAIQAYYDTHKADYSWPERAKAEVASASNKKVIKKVAQLMQNGIEAEKIKKMINLEGVVNVIFTTDTMTAKHQALPKDFDFKKGVSKIYKHNKGYVVAKVLDILPKKQKAYEDVKGIVMSDYQNHKEALWLEELRQKYKVVVNQDILKKAKAKIKKI